MPTDFSKIELTPLEIKLRNELALLTTQIPNNGNKTDRLRWAEDILTIRCRL